jgi:hypothetical protein
MRESGKETLDALGLEGGWGCLMDYGWGTTRYTGVAKGSLSKELAVVGRVAVVSHVLQIGRGGMLSSEGCSAM